MCWRQHINPYLELYWEAKRVQAECIRKALSSSGRSHTCPTLAISCCLTLTCPLCVLPPRRSFWGRSRGRPPSAPTTWSSASHVHRPIGSPPRTYVAGSRTEPVATTPARGPGIAPADAPRFAIALSPAGPYARLAPVRCDAGPSSGRGCVADRLVLLLQP